MRLISIVIVLVIALSLASTGSPFLSFGSAEQASLRSLERAVARAVVLKGPRGEARDLAPLLLRSVEDDGGVVRGGPGERGTR